MMGNKKSLKSSPTIPGLSADIARFVEDFQKETDRGAALAAAAFLDDVLTAMLCAAFIDDPKTATRLLEYPGPISTFGARADLAYAMGLLGPKMHADLKVIREIRNHFAHSHSPVTFDDPAVEGLCRRFQTDLLHQLDLAMGPRFRFICGACTLAEQIMVHGLSLKHAQAGKDFTLGQVVRA
jgi:DNA-binding MltR family transcriptional regulator